MALAALKIRSEFGSYPKVHGNDLEIMRFHWYYSPTLWTDAGSGPSIQGGKDNQVFPINKEASDTG